MKKYIKKQFGNEYELPKKFSFRKSSKHYYTVDWYWRKNPYENLQCNWKKRRKFQYKGSKNLNYIVSDFVESNIFDIVMSKKSKYLSYLLRHNSEDLNISEDGYVLVNDILLKTSMTIDELESLVEYEYTSHIGNVKKKRFGFSEDKSKIRALHGHSNPKIKMSFKPVKDTNILLYHGTSLENYNSVLEKGELSPMKRLFVHLTDDIKVAKQTGLRHAKNKNDLVILCIKSSVLLSHNINLFISESNQVYLSDGIPSQFLKVMKE